MRDHPLTTDRLTLHPLSAADADAFVAYRRVPEVARWQSWTVDYDADAAARLIATQPVGALPAPGHWLQLGVHERSTGDLLGDGAVHALSDQPDSYEIGVTLAPASQGRGVG